MSIHIRYSQNLKPWTEKERNEKERDRREEMPAGEESAMTSGRRVQCPWTSPDKVTLPPTTPRVGGLHPSPRPRACTYDVTRARAPRHALAPRLLYGHVPSTASPPTLSLLSVEHREILIYIFLYGDE